MRTDSVLTNERGEPVNVRLAQFLKQDSPGTAPTGWPRNPPRRANFTDTAFPAGTALSKLAKIMADVDAITAPPLCLGIVDMEAPADVVNEVYEITGWGLDTQITVGSASKTWLMYTAFQLRDDVRAYLRDHRNATQADITSGLQAAWSNSSIPELKEVADHGRMPLLEKIFDLSALPARPSAASGTPAFDPDKIDFIDFKDCGIGPGFTHSPATDALASKLETFHQHEYSGVRAVKVDMWTKLATMPFGHRLWLTVAWSDNAAATTLVFDLGFSYIDAVLSGSHLYEKDINVGARASMNYGSKVDDLLASNAWPAGSSAFARISQWEAQSSGPAPNHAGTVRSFLCFAGALSQRLVISDADSKQMLSLMRAVYYATGYYGAQIRGVDLDGSPLKDEDGDPAYVDGVGSFTVGSFEEFVDDAGVGLHVADRYHPFTEAAAKCGIARGKLADVAIVDIRTTEGKRLHWVVAFTSNRDPGEKDRFKASINQYGIALREIVRRWLL